MEEQIKTYGDLIKVIEDNGLQDKPIILGVEGYNTYCYEGYDYTYNIKADTTINIKEINDRIVLCDNCGSYEEDLFRVDNSIAYISSFIQWFLENEEEVKELYGDYVSNASIEDFLDGFLEDNLDYDFGYSVLKNLVGDTKEELERKLEVM